MNYRMRAEASGFDGTQSYGPGDVVEVDLDHARRALVRGHGHLVGDNNRKLPLAKAIEMLRLPDDDLLRIETADRTVLAMQTKIMTERET